MDDKDWLVWYDLIKKRLKDDISKNSRMRYKDLKLVREFIAPVMAYGQSQVLKIQKEFK